MTAPCASNTNTNIEQAVDWLRYNAIEEMADLASSYWRSIAEAAARQEQAVVNVHCRQVAAVTREAFKTAKKLGAPPEEAA
jgi:hypothetical protein